MLKYNIYECEPVCNRFGDYCTQNREIMKTLCSSFALEFQIRVLISSRDKRRKQEIIQMQKAMAFSAAVLNSVIYRNQISHCFRAC